MNFLARMAGAAGLTLVAAQAGADELDTLLPANIPGFGDPFAAAWAGVNGRAGGTGWRLGGLEIDPGLTFSTGYDSAPNGAGGGSPSLREAPLVALADTKLGLGGFFGGTAQQDPDDAGQNTTDATAAVGERADLAGQTVTVAAAYLCAQESDFSLSGLNLPAPVSVTVAALRASDRLALGQFTVTPEVAVTTARFSRFASQNHSDDREGLTTEYADGGPGRLVLLLHATQTNEADGAFSADTYEALAGVADDAPALWDVRLLAGGAFRLARTGKLAAPVLEASIDWLPTDLDLARLSVSREIDDPDEISGSPATVTDVLLSLSDDELRNFTANVSAEVEKSAFLNLSLQETLFTTATTMSWQMNPSTALQLSLVYNDRQANRLRAANEVVVTAGLAWTP
jgi:hypothetical protein